MRISEATGSATRCATMKTHSRPWHTPPHTMASTTPRTRFNWPGAHWAVGTLTLILFPLAGLYMRYVAKVPQLADAPRLMFRSRFLFLLLIATANLGLSYVKPERLSQRLASILILASPVPLIVSFFVDPGRGVRSSPWTVFTMRGLFVAAILIAVANRPRRSG